MITMMLPSFFLTEFNIKWIETHPVRFYVVRTKETLRGKSRQRFVCWSMAAPTNFIFTPAYVMAYRKYILSSI